MENRRNRGYTLLEMLAAVAILALLCAVVIPALVQVRTNLLFQERNAQARTIFLSAQAQLTRMRSRGELDQLEELPATVRQRGEASEEPPVGYVYTVTGDAALESILPDPEGQILLELDPATGNLFSVFYSRETDSLKAQYEQGCLPRDEEDRRGELLGYYDGGDLENGYLNVYRVAAELACENGHIFSVTVKIPTVVMVDGMPRALMGGDTMALLRGLEVSLTITGERGGITEKIIKARGDTVFDKFENQELSFRTTLDSLDSGGGFSDWGDILPGDNVTITAHAAFRPEGVGDLLVIESDTVGGENILFASLTEGKGGDVLAVTNPRHLKNLNRLDSEIALDVDTVLFADPVESGVGKSRGATLDLQGVSMEPIANPYLFGTAELTVKGLEASNIREHSAEIVGNGTVISNLVLTEGEGLVGLFAYTNGKVDGLFLEDPVIRGTGARAVGALIGAIGKNAVVTNCGVYLTDFTEETGVSGTGAVGGLIGYGESVRKRGGNIANCFSAVPVRADLSGGTGYSAGAGGLVGNAQSCRFQNCYASGTITATGCVGGNHMADENNYLGLTEDGEKAIGAGGFVGTAHGCRFENCFATGNVRADAASAGAFVGVLCYDTRIDDQKAKSIRCYAVGDAVFNGIYGHFSGVNAVIGKAPQAAPGTTSEGILYQNSYYLSKYPQFPAASNAASRYCAQPVTFDALQWHAPERAAGFASGWGSATAVRTHGYGGQTGVYPFALQDGLPYYGNWPEETVSVKVVYWERYRDREELGYYLDENTPNTLRKDAVVVEDGYAILASRERISVTVDGKIVTPIRQRRRVRLGQDAYYAYALPELETAAEFYSEMIVTVGTHRSTCYLNPNSPRSQIFDQKPEEIPSRIPIRSARHLAALGQLETVWDAAFVQELDIDFGLAGISHQPIYEFSGHYDGRGKTISGIKASLFGSVEATGCIKNIHLRGNGMLVDTSAGIITDCTVDGDIVAEPGTCTGLLVGEMTEGLVERCRVAGSVAGTANSTAVGGVVGRVTGGVLADVTFSGTVSGNCEAMGTFVGIAVGGGFRDCHTTGENTAYPFAGDAEEVSTEPIRADATHCSRELFAKNQCSQEEMASFGEIGEELPGKPVYASAFENCTFLLEGQQRDVLEKMYYYQLEAKGGQLARPMDGTMPQAGQYLLMTAEGKLLCVTAGGSIAEETYQPGMTVTPGMLWQAGEENWINCRTSSIRTERTWTDAAGEEVATVTETAYTVTAILTAQPGSEAASVRVDYTVTARITQEDSLGQTQSETQVTQGTASCDVYIPDENRDCAVVYVDESIVLTVPGGKD